MILIEFNRFKTFEMVLKFL